MSRELIAEVSFEQGRHSATLDLGSLNTGVYFVKISTVDYEQTFKIIKE